MVALPTSIKIDGVVKVRDITDDVLTVSTGECQVRLRVPMEFVAGCHAGIDIRFTGTANIDSQGVYRCTYVAIDHGATYLYQGGRASLFGQVVDVRPSTRFPTSRVLLIFRFASYDLDGSKRWIDWPVEYPRKEMPENPVGQLVSLGEMSLRDGCFDYNHGAVSEWRGQAGNINDFGGPDLSNVIAIGVAKLLGSGHERE